MQTSNINIHSQPLNRGRALYLLTKMGLDALVIGIAFLALSLPRVAQASLAYPANVAGGTKLELMCANCHVEWDGGGFGGPNRIAQEIWDGYLGQAPTSDGFALYDMDMDGTVTGVKEGTPAGAEYPNAKSPTKPADNVRWAPMFPDKDGDGCVQLYNRLNESGIMQPPLYITSLGYIGGLRGFEIYGPKGWDIDDNDATQGCNANALNGIGWPTTATPGIGFTNPGSTTDTSSPPQVADIRGSVLASAAIPLVWTAVGDDATGAGASVPAHSYDLRYTQTSLVTSKLLCAGARSSSAGTLACNVRDPGHWKRMWNVADSDATIATWNLGTDAPLMRAFYEPIPSTVGLSQTCTSLGFSATTGACPTGTSHTIKAVGDVAIKGTTAIGTNRITNLNLYWVAIRVSDGVNIPSALEGAVVTEHLSPVSNIVGITTGAGGSFITSFNGGTTPITLSGTAASVSVSGKGLTATLAARLVLTDTTGAVVKTATITTAGTSAGTTPVVGTFDVSGLAVNSKYTLETRTASGTDASAAWVDAVSIAAGPTLTTVTPSSRGQGAAGLSLGLVGTNFSSPMTITFSDTAITGSVATNTITPTTATAVIETVGATVATGAVPGPSVLVTAANVSSNSKAFSITAAPNYVCTPALPTSGEVGTQFGPVVCTATGGVPSYSWVATGLPAGVTAAPSGVNAETLTIGGVPTDASMTSGSIRLTDNNAGEYAVAHTINISKGSQTITLSCTPLSITVGDSSTCVATASSGLPVTLSNTTPSVCSLAGNIVSGTIGGGCVIAGDQAGSPSYNPATQVTSTITVNRLDQTITLSCTPLSITVGDSSTCVATASSGLPVTLSNTTPTVCSLAGNIVSGTIGGGCVIAGDQAGSPTYNPATQVTSTITVNKLEQIITLSCSPLSIFIGENSTCAALASSGMPVTLNNLTPSVCSLVGSVVSGTTGGDCVIAGSQAGSSTYNPATQMTSTIAVSQIKLDQTIVNLSCTSTIVSIGNAVSCTATASSGLPVTLTDFTPTICTLSGSTVTGLVPGICIIAADQPGNGIYNNAQTVVVAVTIDKSSQNITAGGFLPATLSVSGSTAVSATASSMLPVSFSSATPTVCSVSGSIVTGVTVGLCSITANQSGDATYLAALPVTQNISVASVDLVMAVVSTTAAGVGIGHSFAITSIERNLGAGAAVSNTVKFYLSVDATITTTDKLLTGTRTVLAPPAMTDSLPEITTVTIPYTIAPGVYTVGACADVPSVQMESSEANNCKAAIGTITVKRNVDLQMSVVSKTATVVGAGKTFAITNTEKNAATTNMTVASNTVKFYLSIDATVTTTDIAIGSRLVNRLLAGQSNTATTTVTIPGTVLPGLYYVGACADTGNVQVEASLLGASLEGNNCKAAVGTLKVVRNVDLVISALSTPEPTVIEATDFIIDSTVKNVGTAAMLVGATTTTKFYLSTDATITNTDILLTATRTVTGLAGGGVSKGFTVATLPDTVAPGVYYVGAIADGSNQLLESSETNNSNSPSTVIIAVIFDPTL